MTNDLPSYLFCHTCGKCVSSGFYVIPVPGYKGLVVRAYIECPECIMKRNGGRKDARNNV